jgi:hypothetical protein
MTLGGSCFGFSIPYVLRSAAASSARPSASSASAVTPGGPSAARYRERMMGLLCGRRKYKESEFG